MQQIYLSNQEDTKKFATNLAKHAEVGDIITLRGDLGAGKTSFAQYFIQAIAGENIEVTSPTFNLVHLHQLKSVTIWHFDLYRLTDKKEIYELGIEDAMHEGITLIEWPEIISNILPKNRLDLHIATTDKENVRIVSYQASEKWTEILTKL